MTRKHYFMGNRVAPKGIDPDTATNTTIEGVASSGTVSPLGTVAHKEHWDGSVDANVTPGPVSLKTTTHKGASN